MNSHIEQFLSEINSDKFHSMDEYDPFDTSHEKGWIHTGSPLLDYNMGTLGFPPGFVEIAGKSKGGKTTLGLHAIKHHQKKYKDRAVVVLFYSEKRAIKYYAEKIGVDITNIVISKFDFVEELPLLFSNALEAFDKIFKKTGVEPKFLFVWDSLGATQSKAEYETIKEDVEKYKKQNLTEGKEDTDTSHAKLGAFAKPAKLFAKYALSEIYNRNITFIVINHTYNQMGGPAKGQKSSGGEWIEYMPTIRLRVARTGDIKVGAGTNAEKVAQASKVSFEKNDFGSRRETQLEILFGYGLVLCEEDLDYAVEVGILDKQGARTRIFSCKKGEVRWSGRKDYYELYKDLESRKIMDVLQAKIAKARHQDVLRERGLLEEQENQSNGQE